MTLRTSYLPSDRGDGSFIIRFSDRQTLENFELLVRSILLRQDSPAVVVLGHFSPQVNEQNGFAGPDHWHSVVSQFYDVPHVRYSLSR